MKKKLTLRQMYQQRVETMKFLERLHESFVLAYLIMKVISFLEIPSNRHLVDYYFNARLSFFPCENNITLTIIMLSTKIFERAFNVLMISRVRRQTFSNVCILAEL